MFVLVRAIVYSSVFIGFLLIFLPARILSGAGVPQPREFGAPQIAGLVVGGIGALLAVWCILTFVFLGRGTPAPFDPPRRLVVRGPYRHLRNPMYVGAALGLVGAALVYRSWPLFAYALVFGFAMHLFVRAYEEPTLRRGFGADYDDYCRRVRRWIPRP